MRSQKRWMWFWGISMAVSWLATRSSFSAETIRLELGLKDSSLGAQGKIKIFIHNEKSSKTTYTYLNDGSDGEYTGAVQTRAKDPSIIQSYRIGQETGVPARYWSFRYEYLGNQVVRIELLPGKVTRENIQRIAMNEAPASPEQSVAQDHSRKDVSGTDAQEYLNAVALFDVGRLEESKKKFESLSSSSDPKISSYSRYYLGVIHLKEEKFELAEKSFGSVSIDETADPEIRKNSIELLRRSAQVKSYSNRMEKIYGGSVLLDFFQYDSNVESLPSSLSPVTDQSGIGFGLQANAWVSPIKTDENELSFSYGFGATYHPDRAFVNYDLGSHFMTSRYMRKDQWAGKPVRYNIVPGAAFIQSQTDGQRRVPPRNQVLNSWFLQNQFSLLSREDLLIEGRLNFKYDNSKIPVATELDRASGFGTLAGGSFTRYLNASKSKSYSVGANIEWLNATGINYRQLKPSVYGAFNVELPFKLLSRSVLSGFYDRYYDNLANRHDEQIRFETSITRYLTERIWLSQGFAANRNFSNVAIGDYSRFVATSSLGITF